MRQIVIALGGALALSGCGTPLVEPQAPTFQKKVTNAEHWQLMANHNVTRVTEAMKGIPELDPRMHVLSASGTPTPTLIGRRYYIHAPATDMPFSITYKRMMQEALLESGLSVSRRPAGSLIVNFDVETYAYGPRLNKTPFHYVSLYTTLGALGWGLSEIGISTGAGIGILAAAGPILDFLIAMGDVTNAEVLVTTSIVDHTTVLYQETETFYVNPVDLPLYWSMFPPTGPVETGPVEPDLLPMRILNVSAN